MKVKVYLTSRKKDANAEAIYEGQTITVLAGGKISECFAEHIRSGKTAKSCRENKEYVDTNRNIIKDCSFKSPSIAAQFVLGRSVNGYRAWRVDKKKDLGAYLSELGLR